MTTETRFAPNPASGPGPLRLNLGCGHRPLEGFRNIDFVQTPYVDQVVDLENTPWPWADESVSEIAALNVVEHINRMDAFWHEVHRILRIGGQIEIEVTYGNRYDPFHHAIYKRRSIGMLCNGYATDAWAKGKAFRLVDGPHFRNNGGMPWWHIRNRLHIEPPPVPGWPILMRFILEKLKP